MRCQCFSGSIKWSRRNAAIIKNCAHEENHTSSCDVEGTPEAPSPRLIRSTTVLCVRRDDKVVMAGDGQVTLGESVIKHGAKKIRRLYQDKILAGFAGSTADAFTLFSRFEAKLEQYHGNLGRVCRRTGQRLAHRQISAPSRSPVAG